MFCIINLMQDSVFPNAVHSPWTDKVSIINKTKESDLIFAEYNDFNELLSISVANLVVRNVHEKKEK